MTEKSALIVVDVQRDFCEGGALGVDGGNQVANNILEYIKQFRDRYEVILFTMDWHQGDTDNGGHFSDNPDFVDTWPPHCIGGNLHATYLNPPSEGSQLHPAVHKAMVLTGNYQFRKGWGRPDYSGFQGKGLNEDGILTHPDELLRAHKVGHVDVVGIAGDYCVRQTALDAVRLGYDTLLLPSMIASVGGQEATDKVFHEVADANGKRKNV